MVETVKKCLDVKIERPVITPASLPRLTYGTDRRAARTIAVRVRMEHGFQTWLQVSSDNLLGNAIRDSRNAEHPGATTLPFGISTRRTGGGK